MCIRDSLTIVDKNGVDLDMGTEYDFFGEEAHQDYKGHSPCLLYTSPSPRDRTRSRMPSSA